MAEPTLIVVLAGHPPTPNDRMHHMKRYEASQEWKQSAWIAAMEQRPYPCLGRARLHITMVYREVRRRDTDNIIASMKGAIDGLVLAKAISDDQVDVLHTISVTVSVEPRSAPATMLALYDERMPVL